jgi:CheY-like chemotaxis protein
LDGRQAQKIQDLADAMRPAPLVALLDLVRLDERERALAAGAAAVISKPFFLPDLFGQLDRLLQASAGNGAASPAA